MCLRRIANIVIADMNPNPTNDLDIHHSHRCPPNTCSLTPKEVPNSQMDIRPSRICSEAIRIAEGWETTCQSGWVVWEWVRSARSCDAISERPQIPDDQLIVELRCEERRGRGDEEIWPAPCVARDVHTSDELCVGGDSKTLQER